MLGKRHTVTPRFQGRFMTCVKAPGGRPFYYASFCDCTPRAERFFAAVCGNHVTVCELRADGHIDFRQVYADEDTEEQFYTCAWTLAPRESSDGNPASSLPSTDARDPSSAEAGVPSKTSPGPPPKDAVLLIVAGFRGIIKLIDCRTCKLVGALLDYVDCVRWVGDLIMSKSTDNTIVLWRPVTTGPDAHDILVLREYCMRGAEVCWFVRFGLTKHMHQLVCGESVRKT
eukprot:g350.t1